MDPPTNANAQWQWQPSQLHGSDIRWISQTYPYINMYLHYSRIYPLSPRPKITFRYCFHRYESEKFINCTPTTSCVIKRPHNNRRIRTHGAASYFGCIAYSLAPDSDVSGWLFNYASQHLYWLELISCWRLRDY